MKNRSKWLTLGCVALVLAVAGATAQAELLLYYDFEGDAGTSITNLGSLGTSGTLSGPDATVAGPAGGYTPTTARTFDGSSTVIDTNITAVTMDVHQSSNYTMAAWLRPLSTSGDRMVFGQPGGNFLHNGTRGNSYWQGHWGNDIGGGTVNAIPLGNWRHVAWRYNGGQSEILVDGTTVGGPSAKGWLNNAANILVGDSTSSRYFSGDLDDVVIYREALAFNQIQHLADGGDPTNLPAPVPFKAYPSLDWDFWPASLEGWQVLHGGAHFRSGDGGGMTPANATGGFAHDGSHETMLVESPLFRLTGKTLNNETSAALMVQFAGGAGDQGGSSVDPFDNLAEVLAYNGGNANGNGLKGLAFLNVDTGQYDATIFEATNGGVDTRSFSWDDLLAMGLDDSTWYRLHYYENDQGSWGWGQINSIEMASVLPEPGTLALVGFGLAGLRAWRRRRRNA